MNDYARLKFNGVLLDDYLALGYYRMGQYIFTTDSIWNNGKNHFVFWLRYPLTDFYFDKKPQRLLAANKHFTIIHRDFYINEELEHLYGLYISAIEFDAPPTLQSYLFGEIFVDEEMYNVFDSGIIEVRDGNTLVAAGIYDNGETSIAGIMNFYDPSYKKYSLGKHLMLLKIQHAIKRQMKFYYPGYIAYEYEKFDYKLFPNSTLAEIFDSLKKQWLPYNKDLLMQLIRNFSD